MSVGASASVEPHAHVVQLYERDDELGPVVGPFLAGAVAAGGCALVAATPSHLATIEAALVAAGVDVAAARAAGSFSVLEAETALARIVRDGRFDPAAFEEVVARPVRAAAGRDLRVYGEMVTLLWHRGDVVAALELEAAWNVLAGEVPFAVLCAYPASSVGEDRDAVCGVHSAVVASAADVERHTRVAHREYPHSDLSPRAARHFARDTLHRWGLGDVLDVAALVVTELTANAVRHAGTGFALTLTRSGDGVRVEVHDQGGVAPSPRDADWSAEAGRGLGLVAGLAAAWGHHLAEGGTVVWAEVRP